MPPGVELRSKLREVYVLTMEIPRSARVNSGPAETMSLRMIDKTRLLIATGDGTVITMARETSRNAQIRPEM